MPSVPNTNRSPINGRKYERMGKAMRVKLNKPIKSTFEVHRNDSVIELLESKSLNKNASIPILAPIKNLIDEETT